jgi:hypothetical protein
MIQGRLLTETAFFMRKNTHLSRITMKLVPFKLAFSTGDYFLCSTILLNMPSCNY